jgi:Gas vesicle synthesis protein GvpL/GvpF
VIYAYGICEPAVASPMLRRRGLGGASLRVLERGGLAAVYSRHRTLRPRPLPELVCAHERVVEAIMARGAVLPLRFGTQLEREEQLADVLAARRDELLESIERVRGKVELGIRMIPEGRKATSPAAETGGRRYLLARVELNRRHQQAVREVHAVLAELSEASSMRQPPRPPAILVASYLVESERVAEFRRRAERLSERQQGVRVLVTGPWPPYSFAPGEQQ